MRRAALLLIGSSLCLTGCMAWHDPADRTALREAPKVEKTTVKRHAPAKPKQATRKKTEKKVTAAAVVHDSPSAGGGSGPSAGGW